MRDTLIITGLALIAVAVGSFLFLRSNFSNTPSLVAPDVQTPAAAAPTQTTHTVAFRVLDTGTHAASVSVRKNYAAYAKEGFIKIWDMAYGTDGTAYPKIDFSKEYVIGVFAGQKPTGGHSIAVTSITDTGSARTVAVTLTKPGSDCMVTQVLTNPYQIVVVPWSDATLAHTDVEVSSSCN